MSNDSVICILKNAKKGLESLKVAMDLVNNIDTDTIRSVFKHNERLSHCQSESFSLRTILEDFGNNGDIEEGIESVDYLIEEYKNFIE